MNKGENTNQGSVSAFSLGVGKQVPQRMDDLDELWTADEVCQKLKVKKSYLYAPARRKGPDPIPCVKIGKYLRFIPSAVRGWVARQNQ